MPEVESICLFCLGVLKCGQRPLHERFSVAGRSDVQSHDTHAHTSRDTTHVARKSKVLEGRRRGSCAGAPSLSVPRVRASHLYLTARVSLVLHGGLVEADARELRGEGLDVRAQGGDGGVLLRAVGSGLGFRLGLGLGFGFGFGFGLGLELGDGGVLRACAPRAALKSASFLPAAAALISLAMATPRWMNSATCGGGGEAGVQ